MQLYITSNIYYRFCQTQTNEKEAIIGLKNTEMDTKDSYGEVWC